jgi:hypothetical protein
MPHPDDVCHLSFPRKAKLTYYLSHPREAAAIATQARRVLPAGVVDGRHTCIPVAADVVLVQQTCAVSPPIAAPGPRAHAALPPLGLAARLHPPLRACAGTVARAVTAVTSQSFRDAILTCRAIAVLSARDPPRAVRDARARRGRGRARRRRRAPTIAAVAVRRHGRGHRAVARPRGAPARLDRRAVARAVARARGPRAQADKGGARQRQRKGGADERDGDQ